MVRKESLLVMCWVDLICEPDWRELNCTAEVHRVQKVDEAVEQETLRVKVCYGFPGQQGFDP